jgi:uncharacterized coiled-coil protein SlyX
MKTKNRPTSQLRNSLNLSPSGHGFFLIQLVLVCFAVSQTAQAVLPPPAPDGGYPGFNTAEGTNALFNLTTGQADTAVGYRALFSNTTGTHNTATGGQALFSNTGGNSNTANGTQALYFNTTGSSNTAAGVHALYRNTTGLGNTANGALALQNNTTGDVNTADGNQALQNNTTGYSNTAIGNSALFSNTMGHGNEAIGWHALYSNTSGDENTANGPAALLNNRTGMFNVAVGGLALANTTGTNNIGMGQNGGQNLTFGSNNIDIGAIGVGGESNTIRVGRVGIQTRAFIAGINVATITGAPVVVNSPSGQLGVAPSSQRFKDEIKPMDTASEAILALKPVTFRYRKELDPEGIPQFGLVAEDVQKVNPDLVGRNAKGEIYTVRYDAVNAMLLNEFLKEHCKVREQEASIGQLKSTVAKQQATIAQQQQGMEAVMARLNEQAAQIRKVSVQFGSRPARQTVLNNH